MLQGRSMHPTIPPARRPGSRTARDLLGLIQLDEAQAERVDRDRTLKPFATGEREPGIPQEFVPHELRDAAVTNG
jgi:hypothetical protein